MGNLFNGLFFVQNNYYDAFFININYAYSIWLVLKKS